MVSEHSAARTVALWLLILILGASAYEYGSVELWASEWLRFCALLCVAVLLWSGSPGRMLSGPSGLLALSALSLVLWGAIQALPLPRPVIRALSPRTARIYAETVVPGGGEALPGWLLEQARNEGVELGEDKSLPLGQADRGDPVVGRTLSIHPFATRRACLSWLTPILLFLVSTRLAIDLVARSRLLWAIGAWTGLCGLGGVLQQAGWDGRPLWSQEPSTDLLPLLPFINRNHFAGFVGMGTLVVLGLALAVWSRATGGSNRHGIRAALTDRGSTMPGLLGAGILAVLGFSGLVITGSAGGCLAFAFGLIVFLSSRFLGSRTAILVIAVVLLGVIAGVAGLVGPHAGELEAAQFGSSAAQPSAVLRLDLWAKTLRMFLDFPIAGTGLGTFESAFASYQRQGEWGKLDYAHNDYLQLLSETGAVGALLFLVLLAVFLRRILGPALRGRKPRWTTVGVAAAISAMMAHTIVDGNLQIPSNAALFAVLLGILGAAARDQDEGRGEGEGEAR